jgi:hypothetical protein
MRYVMRHGQRIAVETLEDPSTTPKRRRKPFKATWVQLPWHWVVALRKAKRISTYQLALTILFEDFKRKQIGGNIVLSTQMTGMRRQTRVRAAKELAKLGLITIRQNGKEAYRVSIR